MEKTALSMIGDLQGRVFALETLFATIILASILGLNQSQRKYIIKQLKSDIASMELGVCVRSELLEEESTNDIDKEISETVRLMNKQLLGGTSSSIKRYSKMVSKWEKDLIKDQEEEKGSEDK